MLDFGHMHFRCFRWAVAVVRCRLSCYREHADLTRRFHVVTTHRSKQG